MAFGPAHRELFARHHRISRCRRGGLLAAALLVLAQLGTAQAAPTIFWYNDPVGPDDSVIVTGDDLAGVTKVEIELRPAPSDGSAAEPVTRTVEALQATPASVKFTLPADLPVGAYGFRLLSGDDVAEGVLNLPTVYWIQGDAGQRATPGHWLRIFGRNIWRNDRARLELSRDGQTRAVAADPERADLWDARFPLPADLAPGTYALRLSNGDGAREIGSVVIADSAKPANSSALNPRDFGAIGDGTSDDTAALQKALDAAGAAGGGTVLVPPGRYLVSDTLSIPDHVDLAGVATGRVNLIWPDATRGLEAHITGLRDFSVRALTIYASNHGNIIVGGLADGRPAPGAGNIAITDVRIRASAFRGHMTPEQTFERVRELGARFPRTVASISLSGSDIRVQNNDVVGSGAALVLISASDVIVAGNRLRNGRYGWYSLTGCRRVIFEDNDIAALDLQGTGGGPNTLDRDGIVSENMLFRGNTFHDIYGWDREALTTDGPKGFYFGAVEDETDGRLRLLDTMWRKLPFNTWKGAALFVVDGKGVGQWAQIADAQPDAEDGPSVTLEHALAIAPDATSRVTIVPMQRNYLIIDNDFVDTGVAAQTYGTALDHVFAGNRSTRTGGFIARASFYRHFQPNWHIQLLDNEILEGNIYRAGPNHGIFSGNASIAVHGIQPKGRDLPVLGRAIIVRGNRLDADSRITVRGMSARHPGLSDLIIEHNVVPPIPDAIKIDEGAVNLLVRENGAKTPVE